jgi:hypothetical protein
MIFFSIWIGFAFFGVRRFSAAFFSFFRENKSKQTGGKAPQSKEPDLSHV